MLIHAYSQTVADGTATSVVRPSDWNSAHNHFMTLGGNTAGQSTLSGSNVIFQGGNNVTLSAIQGAGVATLLVSGPNTVAQSVQTQAVGNIAGTGYTSTTQAGSTVGATQNTAGLSVAWPPFLTTAQTPGAYLTTARASTDAIGLNTALTANGVSVTANSSGLSLNFPAFLTTAALSQNTSNYAGVGYTSTTQAGSTVGATHNTAGLSMAWPPFLTTAAAAQTTQTQPAGNIAGAGYTSTTTAGAVPAATLNSNGLSMGWPNFITTAALSQNTSNYAGLSTGFTGANISGSMTVNTAGVALSMSVAAGGGGADGNNVIGVNGVATSLSTTYILSNANNVTFGLNAGTITASASYTQTVQTQASGNIAGTGYTSTTQAGSTVGATHNTAGLSMAWPPYLTTYVGQTTQTQPAGNIAGVGTTFGGTNVSGSMTLNSNGLALSLSAGAGGGGADGNNVLGVNAVATSLSTTYILSNANNVSFGLNAGTITASASYTQTVQTQASGNIAGAGYTSTTTAGVVPAVTHNSAGLSMGWPSFITTYVAQTNQTVASGNIAGTGYSSTTQAGSTVGVTHNTAGLSMAWPPFITTYANDLTSGRAGVGTTFAGTNVSASMTLDTNGLNLALSAPTPGGGGAINVSAGTTSGNLQTIVFSNSNGVSFGLNGSTVTASAAGGGGAAFTGFWWQPEVYGNTMSSAHANGTLYLRPLEPGNNVDVDRYIFQQSYGSSITTGAVTASVSAGSASSGSGTWGQTGTVILFSRANTNETNASYNSIISFQSDTYSISAGYSSSVSWSTNASSCSVSWTTSAAVGFIKNIDGNGGFTTSFTGTSGSSTFSSTSTNANSFSSTYIMSLPYAHMSGIRPLFVPGGYALAPGEYWLGMVQSSTSGSTNDSRIVRNAVMVPSMLYFTASSNNYAELGNSVAMTTSNYRIGFGSHSASSLTTTNIGLSQVSLMGSNASLYFALDGKTQ